MYICCWSQKRKWDNSPWNDGQTDTKETIVGRRTKEIKREREREREDENSLLKRYREGGNEGIHC